MAHSNLFKIFLWNSLKRKPIENAFFCNLKNSYCEKNVQIRKKDESLMIFLDKITIYERIQILDFIIPFFTIFGPNF